MVYGRLQWTRQWYPRYPACCAWVARTCLILRKACRICGRSVKCMPLPAENLPTATTLPTAQSAGQPTCSKQTALRVLAIESLRGDDNYGYKLLCEKWFRNTSSNRKTGKHRIFSPMKPEMNLFGLYSFSNHSNKKEPHKTQRFRIQRKSKPKKICYEKIDTTVWFIVSTSN